MTPELPKDRSIKPPYLLGGSKEFIGLYFAIWALKRKMDNLIKNALDDSSDARALKLILLYHQARRVADVSHRFVERYSTTYEIGDLAKAYDCGEEGTGNLSARGHIAEAQRPTDPTVPKVQEELGDDGKG
jgi:hypothetical protein